MTTSSAFSPITPAEAARELLARRRARSNLLAFTQFTKRDYAVSWHHRLIASHLDMLVAGTIKKLMVFVHPRAGKSELTSRRLPAYFLGRYPDLSVIATSYSADLASRMNRDVQRIIDDPSYRILFPETRLFGKNIRTLAQGTWMRNSDFFEVVDRRGSYRSAGVGGGITGMGFDLGIIDDPLKSAKEARSATVRQSQWDWMVSDFLTRQMPDARVLMTLTRWHHDDIAGRSLKLAEEEALAGGWTVLRLPAIAEAIPAHPDDPRRPGEALWPERYGLDFLEAQRAVEGPYGFGSLYQQSPTPREGGLFTYEGLSHFTAMPAGPGIQRVRYWDKGYSAQGDWTVGVRMSRLPDGRFVVEDVVRFRAGPDARNRQIKATAEADDREFGRVRQVIEEPPGAGHETTDRLVREMAGHAVMAVKPHGKKEERAEPYAAQCEAGNVLLVTAPWNRAFIDEHLTAPGGENDDQWDAASGGFNYLATPPSCAPKGGGTPPQVAPLPGGRGSGGQFPFR